MARMLPARPLPPSGAHVSRHRLGGRAMLGTHGLHGEHPALCQRRGNRITNPVRTGAPRVLESNERWQRVYPSPVPS